MQALGFTGNLLRSHGVLYLGQSRTVQHLSETSRGGEWSHRVELSATGDGREQGRWPGHMHSINVRESSLWGTVLGFNVLQKVDSIPNC